MRLADDPPTTPQPTTAVGRLSALGLASILDQSVDCIKLIDLDGTIQYMNDNGLCAMGIDDLCSVRGAVWADLWPGEARQLILASYPSAATGATARFRAFCPTAKGAPRWWDVSVSRVTDTEGQLAGYLSVSRDVTANQQSREALTIAAAELRHRLRNTYQMIASLLTVMARGDESNKEFARQMAARLGALSRAQLLFADDNASCDLENLIPALVMPFGSEYAQVTFGRLPALRLKQPQADAVALVVGELAVNSSKHGAIAHGGHVGVSAAHDQHGLSIIWRERCDRPVRQHAREGGQGMTLMNQIMRTRGGNLAVEWEDHGLVATLTFQLMP